MNAQWQSAAQCEGGNEQYPDGHPHRLLSGTTDDQKIQAVEGKDGKRIVAEPRTSAAWWCLLSHCYRLLRWAKVSVYAQESEGAMALLCDP